MLKTTKLLQAFGKDFPKRLADAHGDYVGLMCGKLPTLIQKVVVVLDLELIDLDEIVKEKPDLIITHHPFIYGTKSQVLKHDLVRKKMVATLEKNRIPVYSLHTNFDAGRGGMNDALANAIGLMNIAPLKGDPLARGGELSKPMHVEAFATFVKQKLHLPYALLISEGKSLIKRVALIGGGGAKYYPTAIEEGFDIFLSGDSAHHVRRGIVNAKFNYLEISHEVELIFIPTMAQYLKNLDANLKVITRFVQAYPTLI
ncbi:MAG: Nif3-like dinuclear metal center hexameric protein [Bacilli bacterium]